MAKKRKKPTLTASERKRRTRVAKTTLLPAGVKAAGARGFGGTRAKLAAHKDHIKSPARLAGWLKGQAKRKGVLSARHPYVGRAGFRLYPGAAKRLGPAGYKRFLAKKRRG